MIRFAVAAIDSPVPTPWVFAAWEVAAFFVGSFRAGDLPIDLDVARDAYISSLPDQADRQAYFDEPQFAEDEMLSIWTSTLLEQANQRCFQMNNAYPFIIDDTGMLVRKPLDIINPIGIGYMFLQFFKAVEKGLIQFESGEDKFRGLFKKIFEYISAYAVTGHKSGEPFMTANSRSARRLFKILSRMCRKIRKGQVLDYPSWTLTQKNRNDGGADCLVYTGDSSRPPNAALVIVGATIQQSAIENKVVTVSKVFEFARFFTLPPAVLLGALVRVQDADELTREKCIKENCELYSYNEIVKGIMAYSQLPVSPPGGLLIDAGIRKLYIGAAGAELSINGEAHLVTSV